MRDDFINALNHYYMARQEAISALHKLYPAGTIVYVNLSHCQKVPSQAEVCEFVAGRDTPEYLRVRLLDVPNGVKIYRNVRYTSIIYPGN